MRPPTQTMKICLARLGSGVLSERLDNLWQVEAPAAAPYHAAWNRNTVTALVVRGLIVPTEWDATPRAWKMPRKEGSISYRLP